MDLNGSSSSTTLDVSDGSFFQIFGSEIADRPFLMVLFVLQIVTFIAIIGLVVFHFISKRDQTKSKIGIAPEAPETPNTPGTTEEKPKHQRHETEMALNQEVTVTEHSHRSQT